MEDFAKQFRVMSQAKKVNNNNNPAAIAAVCSPIF
jgi:hypothetical protein